MGLLDSTIRNIVGKSANFLMSDMTLTRKSGRTYVPGSGVTETETAYTVRGFVDEANQRHIDLGLIEQGDRVIRLLQTRSPAALTFISPGDQITARGLVSVVKGVEQDPAQATWTLFCTPGEPAGDVYVAEGYVEPGYVE